MAAKEGCAVTDWELAEHHFKLGRVLWEMGGVSRTDPEMVRPLENHIGFTPQ